MAATTADLVQEFIELDQARKRKEGEIDKLKEQLAGLEQELLARFERAGVQSMTAASGVTVYVHRQLWAGAKDGNQPALMAALKQVGLGDMVHERVNTQTLSAWVREQAKTMEDLNLDVLIASLPDPLASTITVSEKYSLRARKS